MSGFSWFPFSPVLLYSFDYPPHKRSSLPDYQVTSIVITQRIGFYPYPSPHPHLTSRGCRDQRLVKKEAGKGGSLPSSHRTLRSYHPIREEVIRGLDDFKRYTVQ